MTDRVNPIAQQLLKCPDEARLETNVMRNLRNALANTHLPELDVGLTLVEAVPCRALVCVPTYHPIFSYNRSWLRRDLALIPTANVDSYRLVMSASYYVKVSLYK